MNTESPVLTPMPVAWLVTHWRPGSHDWAWAEEYDAIVDRPETAAIERRVLDEGVGFMDYAAPILLGNDGRVWDGHHRIVLAMKHGIGSVMVEGSVEAAPAPAPSVVPEAAVEALSEWGVDESDVAALREAAVEAVAWKLIDRTSDLADRAPSDETVRTANADARAALPLLTATPSATRGASADEVAEVVTEALTDAHREERGMSRHRGLTFEDESVIRDRAACVIDLVTARFNITPKEQP